MRIAERMTAALADSGTGDWENEPGSEGGFTLIEVLVTIAILGIVAAIAYPKYGDYIEKARRSDAHLSLMSAVQSLERCRSTTFTYSGCTLPASLETSSDGDYAITVDSDASTYTLTATAQNKQAGDDLCPTITINDQGVKGHTGDGPCW